MNEQELDGLYLEALEVEEAGNYGKALEMFRRGAEFGDVNAYNAIGIAYDSGHGVEQNKETAVGWFKRAYNDGENSCYIANIALTYAEMGEFEQSDEWWRKALETGDKSAHLGYAKFLMKSGQDVTHSQIVDLIRVAANAEARMEVSEYEKEEAQKLLDALEKNLTPAAMSELFAAHEEDEVYETGGEFAKKYFEAIIKEDVQNKSAYFFLMLLAIDEKDFSSALAYAEKVKQLSPQDPNLNLNIGRIYELAGTYYKAIDFYKRELALFPDTELAFFNMGTTFLKMRRLNKAIFYFEKTLSAPDSEWTLEALRHLSIIYSRVGLIRKERQIYRKTIALEPDWATPLQNLGATYLDTRDYGRALEILQRAKAMDESDAMIDRNIARAKRGLAKYGDAPKS